MLSVAVFPRGFSVFFIHLEATHTHTAGGTSNRLMNLGNCVAGWIGRFVFSSNCCVVFFIAVISPNQEFCSVMKTNSVSLPSFLGSFQHSTPAKRSTPKSCVNTSTSVIGAASTFFIPSLGYLKYNLRFLALTPEPILSGIAQPRLLFQTNYCR